MTLKISDGRFLPYLVRVYRRKGETEYSCSLVYFYYFHQLYLLRHGKSKHVHFFLLGKVNTVYRIIPVMTQQENGHADSAEQFAFSFPGEGWGHKAAGGGRPPSTDVIARNMSSGLWGFDLILNQGTSGQSLIDRPGALNLAGQEFIPVTAKNHLGNVQSLNLRFLLLTQNYRLE